MVVHLHAGGPPWSLGRLGYMMEQELAPLTLTASMASPGLHLVNEVLETGLASVASQGGGGGGGGGGGVTPIDTIVTAATAGQSFDRCFWSFDC